MFQPNQQLTPHFNLIEFTRSATALARGIDNTPPPDVLINLQQLAQTCEAIRTELSGVPITISSGFRSKELNRAVGGASNSSHLTGRACDFIAPRFGTPFTICQHLAKSTIPFDQLIYERSGSKVWVHIGITSADKTPRRQLLTIDNKGTRNGLWE